MKKNDLADLKGKTEGELKRMLLDFKNNVAKERVNKASKSKNTNFIGNAKRDIARIMTVLSMKKFTDQKPADKEVLNDKSSREGGK